MIASTVASVVSSQSLHRRLAAARVDRDRDLLAVLHHRLLDHVRLLDRQRADHHAVRAGVDPAVDRDVVADAARDLHRLAALTARSGGRSPSLTGRPSFAPLEIDDVQAPRPLRHPVLRHRDRIDAVHGLAGVVALRRAARTCRRGCRSPV